jgi:hypothetical protein
VTARRAPREVRRHVDGLSRGRRIAVRLLAVLALVAFNFMLVFVFNDALGRVGETQALEPPGSPQARIGAEHPGEAAHIVGAALAVTFGVTGLAGLLVGPQRAGSATHAGLAAGAWLVAAAVVGDPDNYGGHAGPIDFAFVVLAVPTLIAALLASPWRAWRSGGVPRPEFLVAAAAGVPWLWHGLQQGLMQRYTWPPMADPHHQAHWFVMSLVAFLIVLVCAGAALSGSGWRVATVTSGASGTAIAVASLAAPESASALQPAWAVGALLWGLTILALTWRASRLENRSMDPSS